MECWIVYDTDESHVEDSICGIYLSPASMIRGLKDMLEGHPNEDEEHPFSEMSDEKFLDWIDEVNCSIGWFNSTIQK
jgi:hypothetical protein